MTVFPLGLYDQMLNFLWTKTRKSSKESTKSKESKRNYVSRSFEEFEKRLHTPHF